MIFNLIVDNYAPVAATIRAAITEAQTYVGCFLFSPFVGLPVCRQVLFLGPLRECAPVSGVGRVLGGFCIHSNTHACSTRDRALRWARVGMAGLALWSHARVCAAPHGCRHFNDLRQRMENAEEHGFSYTRSCDLVPQHRSMPCDTRIPFVGTCIGWESCPSGFTGGT